MLTKQEIKDKKFEKAVFGGYDMSQVDEFLDQVMEDFSAMQNDNAALKSKLKILVDKIEEYRSVDEAMRKALLSAQNMAGEIMENAKRDSAQILLDAENEATRMRTEVQHEIEQEEVRVFDLKKRVEIFVSDTLAMFDTGIQNINDIKLRADAEPVSPIKAERPTAAKPYLVNNTDDEQSAPDIDGAVMSILSGGEGKEKILDEINENVVAKLNELDTDQNDEMKTKFIEVKFGDNEESESDRRARRNRKARNIRSSKFIDEDDTDTPFTPKPNFDFGELKFGKNYNENDV